MTSAKSIGDFVLNVSTPFPCWIEIEHNGSTLRFSHRDLPDLAYAIRVAERECAEALTPT